MTEYRIFDKNPDINIEHAHGEPTTDRLHALAVLTACKEVASMVGLHAGDFVLQKREGGAPWEEVPDV